MSSRKDGDAAPSGSNGLWCDPWIQGVFLLFLVTLGGATTFILFRDGKQWVLLMALAASALLWGLESLEIRYILDGRRIWHALEGYLLPVVIISLATFAACFPTLNVYFIGNDFGYLHHFHTLSLPQLLRLFHTDIAQVLWRAPRQEVRPFYGLYYMVSYQICRAAPGLFGAPPPSLRGFSPRLSAGREVQNGNSV